MGKLNKKVISVLVAMNMALPLGQSVFAYKWGETPTVTNYKELLYENTGVSDGVYGIFSICDKGYSGNGIEIGGKEYLTQTFFRPEEAEQYFRHGRMMISFDIKAEKTDNAIVFGINDENTSHGAFVMNAKGKMYFNSDSEWPTANYLPDNAKEYRAGVWYRVKILVDAQNRRIVYFLNNEYWGEYSIKNNKLFNTKIWPNLKLEQFFVNCYPEWSESGKSTSKFVIDNVQYGLPIINSTDLVVETPTVGNIMFEGNSDIKYTVCNDSNTSKRYVLKYDIRSNDNRTSQSGEKSVVVNPNSETTIAITANTDRKGFYTAYTKLETTNGSLVGETETRFSVISKVAKNNTKIGFSANPMTHGVGSTNETIAVSEYLGAGLYREDFPWSLMYKNDGITKNGDWAWLVNYPKLIKNTNGELLAVLGPGLDNMAGVNWPITEQIIANTSALGQWGNYCEQLARLLKGNCNNFEVYNEWAGQAFNKTKATAAAYAQLLKQSAASLRAGNTDVKITAFCCFYTDAEWLENVIVALGTDPGQYFDAISLHPYMSYWSNLEYPEEEFIKGMNSINAVLKKYGLENKPIYASEYGFSSGYSINNNGVKTYPITERVKAGYNARMLVMDAKYFDKAYIYTICNRHNAFTAENVGNRDVDYETNLGFTVGAYKNEIPYEALPSALVIAAYNSLMTDAEYLADKVETMEQGTSDDDLYMYQFKLANNKKAIALWMLKNERTISLNVGANSVDVYDMYGNKRTLDAYNNYITLRVSDEPLYIVADSLSNLSSVVVDKNGLFGSDSYVQAFENYNFYVNMKAPTEKTFDFSARCGQNTTFDSAISDTNGMKLKILTGGDRKSNSAYNFSNYTNAETIDVLVKDGAKIYYDETVNITYKQNSATEEDSGILSNSVVDNKTFREAFEIGGTRELTTVEKEKNNGKLLFKVLQ